MADTLRTLSALQTLLADNTSQNISPQDLRDFLVSAVGHMVVNTLSSNATLDADYTVIIGTGGASGITLTLPPVASSQHKVYAVFKADGGAGAVTLDGNSSEEINGSTTLALSNQYDCAILWCDGTAWYAWIGA